MAESRQMGAAIITERDVTQSELIRKGPNPKCPLNGPQSFETNRCQIEYSLSMPEDLYSKPAPRRNGRMKIKTKQATIHPWPNLSRRNRLTLKIFPLTGLAFIQNTSH